ncbi:hypothetical protein MMC30_003103 [Trapelia coarctata]|nr:hypothetical protein [Trapelia coarctata]
MAAISAAISNARAVAGRAVHIKIHPRPRNITESREILRVLQQYGEVMVFKNLKYEPGAPAPNTALAIYRKDEAAERAMNASPIRFVYGEVGGVEGGGGGNVLFERDSRQDREAMGTGTERGDFHAVEGINASLRTKEDSESIEMAGESAERKSHDPDITPPKTSQWQSMPNLTPTSTAPALTNPQPVWAPFPRQSPPPSIPSSTSPFEPPPPEPRLPPLECSLAVSPSGLNHATYISRQYYHGAFHPTSRTIPSEDLEFRVPLAGYADLRLDKAEVPLRIRNRREREGRRGIMGEMGGLRGLWEREGQREVQGVGKEKRKGRKSGIVWSSAG